MINKHQEGEKKRPQEERYMHEIVMKLFSCPFCTFIEEIIGLTNLEDLEDIMYLQHMRKCHGLER